VIKLSAKQAKQLDQRAQDEYGIPGLVLMENAGLRASEVGLGLLRKKKNKKVVVFCGPGNNGGDGFVLARHLINHDIQVKVFILVKTSKIKADALINYNILVQMKAAMHEVLETSDLAAVKTSLNQAGLVVDAIFGIGLNKDVGGIFEGVINLINGQNNLVLCLDTPSGLCADSGKIFKVGVRANTTVTFGVAKKGFFLRSGPKNVGRLIVADIGLPAKLIREYK